MAKDIPFTREGYEKLKAELEELKGPTRFADAEAIREAKSHGDLNQTRLESRISDLERAFQKAKVVERPAGDTTSAHLGSKIQLRDLEFSDDFEISLVGSFEADPSKDLISIGSPLGEALLGRIVGEEVTVEAPDGVQRYRVLAIE